MKRDQKRKLLKQARYERSRRRKYHWDAVEVAERVLGPFPKAACARADR